VTIKGVDISYGQRHTAETFNDDVLLLHCVVGPYIFTFYIMFHLNNNNDV